MYQTAFASPFAVSQPFPSWQMGAEVQVTPTSPFSEDFSGPFPARLHFLGLFCFSTLRRFAKILSLIRRNGETSLPRRYSVLINKLFTTFREKRCPVIVKVKLFNIFETSGDVYWSTWRNIRCHISNLAKTRNFHPNDFYIPGCCNVPSGRCHCVYLVSLLAL